MNRYDYTPNERLCKRAARLWRKKMEDPEFDQLGARRSEQSVDARHREAFAQGIVSSITKNTTTEQLDKFEAELTRLLLTEYAYREMEEVQKEGETSCWWNKQWCQRLGSDYHPEIGPMTMALKHAKLPEQQVPIKSHMWIGESHVQVAFGYGARQVYHYPIEDGRWLVTTLSGEAEDVRKLIQVAVERPGLFTIDGD